MKSISSIDTFKLSTYINVFRKYFLEKNFFEQSLYSTNPYNITNTEFFKLKEKLFLRTLPEPDVFEAATELDKFFWIGSLFRKEKEITKIHKNEFKLLDFYIKSDSQIKVTQIFFDLLKTTEKALQLKELSNKQITYIDYQDFIECKFKHSGKYWLIVENFPINESFYDSLLTNGKASSKFEIVFVNSVETIEIAAAGLTGENLNKEKSIIGLNYTIPSRILKNKFVGLGFGIERLIYLYESVR